MSTEKMDTRSRILEATWRLLEEGAANAVRMADIAKAAGISRQALYLHYPNRADLLVATTRHIDAVKHVDARLAPSRSATTGAGRLDAFIDAWGNYIPEIYGVGRALMAMQDSDAEARHAWSNRMQAMREGCEAAVRALDQDGLLAPGLMVAEATDLLWTLLSVRNWEHLTRDCGWTQEAYLAAVRRLARQALVVGDDP